MAYRSVNSKPPVDLIKYPFNLHISKVFDKQNSSQTLFIFLPGLWANVMDYKGFLYFVASKLTISKIKAFEFSDMLGRIKSIEHKYNYDYLFEAVYSFVSRKLISYSKIYIMGHSLGAGIALGLYCRFRLGMFNSPQNVSIEFWALSPGGLPGNFLTSLNYWFVLPLKHLLSRSPVGSVPSNILKEAWEYKNPILPFRHFANIVRANFLDRVCKDLDQKDRGVSNIRLHIVNAVHEDVIPAHVVTQINHKFKELAQFHEVPGTHNWPMVRSIYKRMFL